MTLTTDDARFLRAMRVCVDDAEVVRYIPAWKQERIEQRAAERRRERREFMTSLGASIVAGVVVGALILWAMGAFRG